MAMKHVISLLHYHYQLFWNWTQPRAFQDQMISLILCARSTLWLLYQIKTYTFISDDCRTCKASCCSYWRHSPSPMSGILLTWISRYFLHHNMTSQPDKHPLLLEFICWQQKCAQILFVPLLLKVFLFSSIGCLTLKLFIWLFIVLQPIVK